VAAKKKEEIVIPVVRETARVVKRAVDRGSVQVSKIVTEHEELVDTSTVEDEIEIEHVARDQWLDKPAEPRREGDTLIIPIMEEVTVIEKRILLREELHIRTRKVKKPATEKVKLRKEEVRVVDTRRRGR
jgi:stress response protein YsnF